MQVYCGLVYFAKFLVSVSARVNARALQSAPWWGGLADRPTTIPVAPHEALGSSLIRWTNYSPRDFWMISSATAFGTSA
ncbi:hypothetical protein IW252_002148 [Zhihengliuella flava]|uniref:Uncharacterized protein n=1 Tax=Zhihengliuella flava TaxID=1285193 RepID=A0A931DD52_9MICC|nr:hypothetical protein [Zhihengliuella flava]